jgi:hypothetical protein
VLCQVEAWQTPRNTPRSRELVSRYVYIQHKYETEWLGELPELARQGATFFRGLVDNVGLTAADWLRCAADLVAATPLSSLHLEEAVTHLAEVAACPHLANLRHLDLSGQPVGDDGAELLANSPYLTRLRTLDLDVAGIGDRGAFALAASASLLSLRELRLRKNPIGILAREALRHRFGAEVLFEYVSLSATLAASQPPVPADSVITRELPREPYDDFVRETIPLLGRRLHGDAPGHWVGAECWIEKGKEGLVTVLTKPGREPTFRRVSLTLRAYLERLFLHWAKLGYPLPKLCLRIERSFALDWKTTLQILEPTATLPTPPVLELTEAIKEIARDPARRIEAVAAFSQTNDADLGHLFRIVEEYRQSLGIQIEPGSEKVE